MDRSERTRDVIVTPLLAAPKPWSIDEFSPFGRNVVNAIVQDPAYIYGRSTSNPAVDRMCSGVGNDGLKFKTQPTVIEDQIKSRNEGVSSEQIIDGTPLEEIYLRRENNALEVGKVKSFNQGVVSEQIIEGTPYEEICLRRESKGLGIAKPKITKKGRSLVISPKRKIKLQPKMRQTKLTEILEVQQTSSKTQQDWCLSNDFVETVFGAAKSIMEVPKLHQRKLTDMLPKRKGISDNRSEELVKRKWESSSGGGAKKAKYLDGRKSHRTDDDSFDPSTRYKE